MRLSGPWPRDGILACYGWIGWLRYLPNAHLLGDEEAASDLVKPLKKIGGENRHSSADSVPKGRASAANELQAAKVSGVPGQETAQEDGDEGATQADLRLVAKAQAGDLQAFRELVSKYQTRAQAVALGIVGNHHDAEDLIQEAFLKAFRNLHAFRGQSGFYTWLYRIVFNLAIDLGRRKYRKSEVQARDEQVFDGGQRHSSVDASSYMSRSSGPDEEFERAEIRRRIDSAISQLSPDHRAVILMREVDGLSYEEISDALKCSKGTVMSRLHHARRKLQRALADLTGSGTAAVGGTGGSGSGSSGGNGSGGPVKGGSGEKAPRSFSQSREAFSQAGEPFLELRRAFPQSGAALSEGGEQFFAARDVEELDASVEPVKGSGPAVIRADETSRAEKKGDKAEVAGLQGKGTGGPRTVECKTDRLHREFWR